MGCTGSKTNAATAQSQNKEPIAPVAVGTPCPPIVAGCFIVALEAGLDVNGLGIEVEVLGPEKKCLFVKSVSEQGLIPTWNANLHSSEKVCIGDVIHQVNGISGDSTVMLEKLKEKSVMLLLKHDDPQCIVPPAGKEVVEQANDPATPAEALPPITTVVEVDQCVGDEDPVIETTQQEQSCSLMCR